MTSTRSRSKTHTLEDLVLQHGPIELQNPLSKQDFAALTEHYPELAMEREKDGITTIMSPVKKGSGKRESTLIILLGIWNLQTRLGEVYSPSTGFDLPDGSTKSPDVAWISVDRIRTDTGGDEEFVRMVPDFVAEIRSGSDRLPKLQKKMTDTWLANGVRLAWLIDPYQEKAYIYRPGLAVTVIKGFTGKVLSGEEVLPGFELPLEVMQQ